MKKAFLLSLFILSLQSGNSQQLLFEVFSGVNATAYDKPQYNDTQWYVPIGIRLAGGHEHVQLGIEYRQNITHPAFNFDLYKDEFEETYKGIFLRGNFSSLPAYRFGLVLKAGVGYYESTQNYYDLPSDVLNQKFEYKRQLGYNASIGVSAPIYTVLHWEIGYQFNYVERPEDALLSKNYNASYHSFQMGLSLNLVFGNTQKKCRRVISSNRRKRGW